MPVHVAFYHWKCIFFACNMTSYFSTHPICKYFTLAQSYFESFLNKLKEKLVVLSFQHQTKKTIYKNEQDI